MINQRIGSVLFDVDMGKEPDEANQLAPPRPAKHTDECAPHDEQTHAPYGNVASGKSVRVCINAVLAVLTLFIAPPLTAPPTIAAGN